MTVEIGESFVRPVRIIPSTVPWTTECTLTLQTLASAGGGSRITKIGSASLESDPSTARL